MGNSQGKPVEFDGEGAYHSICPLLFDRFGLLACAPSHCLRILTNDMLLQQ